MKNAIKRLFVISFIIYIFVGVLLYIMQRDLLYFKSPNLSSSYPTLIIEDNGEKIRILILNKGKENAIIYFGGNGESMGVT